MGRPKKSVPATVEPEDESQESPEEEPAVVIEPTPAAPAVSKAEAVRIALSEGLESPGDIHEFVLKKFGHDIPNQMISSYKAQEKARQAKKAATAPKAEPAKRGRKPKSTYWQSDPTAPPLESYFDSSPLPKAEPDILLALEGVKELVSQFGADKVKRMVDLLG